MKRESSPVALWSYLYPGPGLPLNVSENSQWVIVKNYPREGYLYCARILHEQISNYLPPCLFRCIPTPSSLLYFYRLYLTGLWRILFWWLRRTWHLWLKVYSYQFYTQQLTNFHAKLLPHPSAGGFPTPNRGDLYLILFADLYDTPLPTCFLHLSWTGLLRGMFPFANLLLLEGRSLFKIFNVLCKLLFNETFKQS